jgi:hypothetical protein
MHFVKIFSVAVIVLFSACFPNSTDNYEEKNIDIAFFRYAVLKETRLRTSSTPLTDSESHKISNVIRRHQNVTVSIYDNTFDSTASKKIISLINSISDETAISVKITHNNIMMNPNVTIFVANGREIENIRDRINNIAFPDALRRTTADGICSAYNSIGDNNENTYTILIQADLPPPSLEQCISNGTYFIFGLNFNNMRKVLAKQQNTSWSIVNNESFRLCVTKALFNSFGNGTPDRSAVNDLLNRFHVELTNLNCGEWSM